MRARDKVRENNNNQNNNNNNKRNPTTVALSQTHGRPKWFQRIYDE
jgi:hypothetical protein